MLHLDAKREPGYLRRVHAEHVERIDAVERRDADLAIVVLRNHLRTSGCRPMVLRPQRTREAANGAGWHEVTGRVRSVGGKSSL
jgi:DNA-binding GntR family transcriptional regulator